MVIIVIVIAAAVAAHHHVAPGIRVPLPVAAAVAPASRARRIHLSRKYGTHRTGPLHANVLVQQRHGQIELAQLALDAFVTLRRPDRGIEQGHLGGRVLEKPLLRDDLARLLVTLPLLHSVIVVFRSGEERGRLWG